MERPGVEMLGVFGFPPVEHIERVADLGCRHISSALTSFPHDPPFHPPFSLRDDPDLGRSLDQFGILAEMAAESGIEKTVEFSPGTAIDDLNPHRVHPGQRRTTGPRSSTTI